MKRLYQILSPTNVSVLDHSCLCRKKNLADLIEPQPQIPGKDGRACGNELDIWGFLLLCTNFRGKKKGKQTYIVQCFIIEMLFET